MDQQPNSNGRRRFLALSAAGVVAATGAGWAVWSRERSGASTSRGSRPLLVLLLPEANPRPRGEAWAAFLDDAPDSAQALLALCDLEVMSGERAHERWDEVPSDPARLPIGLLTHDGQRVVPLVAPLPVRLPFDDPAKAEQDKAWLATMEAALSTALDLSEERFLAAARATLEVPEISRDLAINHLAHRARDRHRQRAPRGAKWAIRRGGCAGIVLEDGSTPGPHYLCGIAMMTVPAKRFLYLYTK